MKTRARLALFVLLILVNIVGIVTSAQQGQGRVPAPLATESATPLPTEATATATATSEFTVTPPATATEIPGTQIVVNGGFELDSDGDKVPDGWQVKLPDDKQVCNKVNRPGKPDKIVAYAGNCAFQFKGGGKLIQTSNTPYGDTDYTIWISSFYRVQYLTVTYKIVVKLTLEGNITAKLPIELRSGTHNYGLKEILYNVTIPVTRTKIIIKGGTGNGRLWLDDIRVYVSQIEGTATLER